MGFIFLEEVFLRSLWPLLNRKKNKHYKLMLIFNQTKSMYKNFLPVIIAAFIGQLNPDDNPV